MSRNFGAYVSVPVRDLCEYWFKASNGSMPLPWRSPPVLMLNGVGASPITQLLIVTNTDKAYTLGWNEFYRLMFRDGFLRLVHPNGAEEIVLTAHGSYSQPFHIIKEDNVIYLKRS